MCFCIDVDRINNGVNTDKLTEWEIEDTKLKFIKKLFGA